MLLEEIRRFKLNALQRTITDATRKVLSNVDGEISNIEPGRGILRIKRRREVRGVNPGNIWKCCDWAKSTSMVIFGNIWKR